MPQIWHQPSYPDRNFSDEPYFGAANVDDLSDGVQKADTGPDCGMPVWSVSEPYMSLWLRDEPIFLM